jgi:hypothetical protein
MRKTTGVMLAMTGLLLGSAGTAAAGILDPHREPARCFSCHRDVPEEGSVRAGDLALLAPTIDETCAICHGAVCCEPAARHRNHPTSIDRWNDRNFRRPRTLPLFDGYITCATCHLHRYRDQPGNRLLLRIVKELGDDKYDWTELCHDCHTDY